ncbi:hypothetical protein BX666DRAFT_2030979 [Dichotomocladium elegans]|nr:hypothetical protein BX666DRAFT_2030979 [Dichotomocladium elegans]
MASFAPVNQHHLPFTYDPSSKPAKSILKQKSHVSRTSSWLSNINSKLASNLVEANFKGMNSTVQDNSSRQTQEQQQQQETARPLSLFRKFINNNNTEPGDGSSITSMGSTEGQAVLFDTDELTPKDLKRVRFSVGQLTTEYYPHRKSSDSEREELTKSATDACKLSETATDGLSLSSTEDKDRIVSGNISEIPVNKTTPVSKKSPEELLELYEMACRNKEETPFFGFMTSIKEAIDVAALTTIDFSGQPLTRRVVEPMADVLGYVYQLHNLNLSNCSLEDDAIKVLLHALLLNDTLTHLHLANNKNIKTTGFKYIAIYVKGAAKLEYLDLSMMNPDKKSIQYLSQSIASNDASGANTNNEHHNVDLPAAPSIRYLKLDGSNCKINYQGAIWIGVMLRDYDSAENMTGLYELNIDNNDIRQGIQYIGQALRRNHCLKTLSMRDCKLDAKGCVFIGEALKYNQFLETLDLSTNALNNTNIEGILSIKQALYTNTSLKDLSLSDIGLTSEGAIALAECLPENQVLFRLDLSKNPGIELAGLMALAASLRLNHLLSFLDVNIPPNDREMAKLQSDIVAKCTINAQSQQLSQQPRTHLPPGSTGRSGYSNHRQGSQSSLDSRATAPTTARLTLQERLAAVTRGKASPPIKPAAPMETISVTSSPPQKPRRSEMTNAAASRPVRVTKPAINAEMIAATITQVSLFEELLVAEAGQRDETVDNVQLPGDLILQVFDQCKKTQEDISSRIAHVTDSDQLVQLLEVNDRLTAAISRYQCLFTFETMDNTKQADSIIPAVEGTSSPQQERQAHAISKGDIDTSLSSNLLYINTNDPPLSTSFEIGDVDEDDDLVPSTHPSSPCITTAYQVD